MSKAVTLDLTRQMMRIVPQLAALGIEAQAVAPGRATLRLPWKPELVGWPETGVPAGGAVCTLIDTSFGVAVFSALGKLLPVATLDLRIDYLKPATTGRDLFASAHCYRLTRHVAFVRGSAWHDSEEDAVAQASATFVIERGAGEGDAA